jgi:hypothetical protein
MCRWDGHWHAFFRVRVPDAYFLAAGIGGVAALLGVFIGLRVRNARERRRRDAQCRDLHVLAPVDPLG